jgi:hypothetical protein
MNEGGAETPPYIIHILSSIDIHIDPVIFLRRGGFDN